jgi:hypothetical protein
LALFAIALTAMLATLLIVHFSQGTYLENSESRRQLPKQRIGIPTSLPVGESVLLLPTRRDAAAKIVERDGNTYTIRTGVDEECLLGVGATDSLNYDIKLTLRRDSPTSNHLSRVGVFLGHGPSQIAGDEGERQFQAIILDQRIERRPILSRALGRTRISPGGEEQIGFSPPLSSSLLESQIKDERIVIAVQVRETGLQAVTLNGDPMYSMTTQDVNALTHSSDYEGGFGVFVRNATVTVVSAELTLYED